MIMTEKHYAPMSKIPKVSKHGTEMSIQTWKNIPVQQKKIVGDYWYVLGESKDGKIQWFVVEVPGRGKGK